MQTSHVHLYSGTRLWASRVLASFVALAFLGSGATKLLHVPKVIEGLVRAGIPESLIVPIGVLELCLVALYLYPRTSVSGTFLLTGYIGGAILTHIVGKQSVAPPLIVGLLMFAASYLRHEELRKLVPFRDVSVPVVKSVEADPTITSDRSSSAALNKTTWQSGDFNELR
jgi:hypothetical protein